jgi:hypothetical protein
VALAAVVAALASGAATALMAQSPEWPYSADSKRLVVQGLPRDGISTGGLLEWAGDFLAGQCMAANGFQYVVVWRTPASESGPTVDLWSFGSADVAQARKTGYGDTGGGVDRHSDPNVRYVEGLSPARQAAYNRVYAGDPGNAFSMTLRGGITISTSKVGCLAEAQSWLYGDAARWFVVSTTVSNLDLEVQPAVVVDARYTSALGHWRTCLLGKGYDFENPVAARNAGIKYGRTDKQREVSLAVADAECTSAVRLLDVVRDVYQEKLGTVRDAHRTEINDYDRLRTEAAARAGKVLTAAQSMAPTSNTGGK